MNYIIDKESDLRSGAEYLTWHSPEIWTRTIPTTQGRHALLLLADNPTVARRLYAHFNVDLIQDNLADACGLTTRVVWRNGKQPQSHSVKIDSYYDLVVGIFRKDCGFVRNRRSIVRTVAHEAAHSARYLAAKDAKIYYGEHISTDDHDELVAKWAGDLTQKFLDALELLKS